MDERFQEKVIIITGAASGIGEATARLFAAEGAKVALVDRNKDALEKVAKSLPADRTMAHAADVSDSRAVDAMVTAVVGHFGRLDIILNNAGVHEGGDPAPISDDRWRKVLSTDVGGVFYGAARPYPILRAASPLITHSIEARLMLRTA
ncbi:NADP-dependent 3-hydroxy acid dehydrogenase YdfG [Bradyrhizobium sp. USDA 4011]